MRMDGGNYKIFTDSAHKIEEPNSNFNQHRREVIKYSIEKSLSTAIANYNNYTSSTNNFQMPKLKEDEWDKILQHVSIISFLQGLNIGGKVYNGYSIITNTKTKEVVSEDSIYLLDAEPNPSIGNAIEYHKVNEKNLVSNNNLSKKCVLNIDLERRAIKLTTGENKYYYPIYAMGSYNSVINQNDVDDIPDDNIYKYLFTLPLLEKDRISKPYFIALGRERYTMYKTENDYVKLKNEQMEP